MKWINFLFNPSKKVKHLLTKKKDDDLSYISERLAKLNLKVNTHLKTTSHFDVFSKFFLLIGLTLFVGFGIYFKMVNTPLNQIADFIYRLKIPILSCEFELFNCNRNGNVQSFLLLGSMGCLFLGICFWWVTFQYHLSFLSLTTFILAIVMGNFLGIVFFLYKDFLGLFNYILHLLFWIPFSTTIFVLSLVSWLYYFKKICLSKKKANLIITLFLSFYFINVFFIIYYYLGGLEHWYIMVIGFFLAILDIVLSTLMWIVTLQQLDQFIEQKISRKYQWILISALFNVAIRIFMATLYIVVVIIKMMKLTEK